LRFEEEEEEEEEEEVVVVAVVVVVIWYWCFSTSLPSSRRAEFSCDVLLSNSADVLRYISF